MPEAIQIPVILQVVGVVVIIAEIILPSGGILSILAAGLFGYSLYLVFSNSTASIGMVFVIADLILIPILVYIGIKVMARSPVTLRTMLSKDKGVSSQNPRLEGYLGLEGRALTDLRPSGMAVIADERLDVVTRGEYLEKGTLLIVTAVRGNQIIVKKNSTAKKS